VNYADHIAESGHTEIDFPTVFGRYSESLVGHNEPLIVPTVSTQLDYEGELVAIIGKGGRHISRENALAHVAGYSIFNDGSIRDYQLRTTQWILGKTFDGTGAFGPVFVTADELPDGCNGCHLTTRVNGAVVQSSPIDNMIFDVATLVSTLSEAMTLSPGDIIVTGTPEGVGFAQKPQVFLKSGDVCEVEIDQIGILRNVVANEADQ
jgi:2-keto-4-pentenoate hydratase/2-oxohepta-3-ene-1,7-dioic acid hydratase in catechol pathway